jgi:hypothetical protein
VLSNLIAGAGYDAVRLAMRTGVIALAVAVGSISACAPYQPYPVCDFRALDGQSNANGPVLLPAMAGAMAPVPLNAVDVTDQRILRKVLVQSTNARRTETNSIRVAVQVINCTDHPLQVEARSLFFDAENQSAEAPSAWQRLHLPPRTVSTYSEQSLGTTQVVGYLVELREGR